MYVPESPPSMEDVARRLASDPNRMKKLITAIGSRGIGAAPNGQYEHWDLYRHRTPPAGLTPEEGWFAVKMARLAITKDLPLTDAEGRPFRYALPSALLEMLHQIDRDASGNIEGRSEIVLPSNRKTYLFRSLVEEAITSSQLEGAATTRKVAKAMIQEGRPPINRDERMILNNYRAMLFVREISEQPLTPATVCEIQRIVTHGTLEDEDAAGRFRTDDEEIVIRDDSGAVLHVPPPADQLHWRLATMCDFANGKTPDEFIPPVVRSILLHFWLAYDHPFVDGNGRTARALYYWSMARDKYWLCEYVPISRILKRVRAEYARSYLYTESDDNDLTYFLLFQCRVLMQSIQAFQQYLRRKTRDLHEAESLVERARKIRRELNPRQLALLTHALKNPEASYTVESHQNSHRISYETARSDLLSLARQRILTKRKSGRAFAFEVPADLKERLTQSPPQAA